MGRSDFDKLELASPGAASGRSGMNPKMGR